MIRVDSLEHWFVASSKVTTFSPWGPGSTPRALCPKGMGGLLTKCLRNGGTLDPGDWDRQLVDGDHLVFAEVPGFDPASVAIGSKTLAFASADAFLSPNIFGFITVLAQQAAISLAIQALLGPSDKPSSYEDDSSSTYGFLGLQRNRSADGMALPVLYGRHRVAGRRIYAEARNRLDINGDPVSELRLIFVLSEGPINKIGNQTADGGPFSVDTSNFLETLQIENQPAENFEGVIAHVRMGSSHQDPIDGFEDIFQTFSVDQTLNESVENDPVTDVEATPGITTAASAEITKWDQEVSYTMGEDADEFQATLVWPQGLYNFTSTGSPRTEDTKVQFRYRAVNSGGTPIGDYIILPPEPVVTVHRRGPFGIEFNHRFFDPTDYTAPQLGRYLSCPVDTAGTDGYVVDDSLLPAPGLNETEFTWHGHFLKLSAHATNERIYLFSWGDLAANDIGLAIWIETVSGSTRLKMEVGNGSASPILQGQPSGPLEAWAINDWIHLAVTFKATAVGTDSRVRFYVNGALNLELIGLPQLFLDYSQGLVVAADENNATATSFHGGIDAMQIFTRELTPFEIASKWNQGVGIPGDDNEPGLILDIPMDTFSVQSFTRFATVSGPGAQGNGLDMGADPVAGDDAFITSSNTFGIVTSITETGTFLAGRYLVECHRINAETTDPSAADEVSWSTIELRDYEVREYPDCALLAVIIPSTDQISTDEPLVTVIAEGRPVPVWDGGDPNNPIFVSQYTNNPAWIAIDAATDERYGGGDIYTLENIGKKILEWQAFADYSDILVYDGAEDRLVYRANGNATPAPPLEPDGNYTFEFDTTALVLPPNFPDPTENQVLVDTGFFLGFTGTGASPAEPAWITEAKTFQSTVEGLPITKMTFAPAAGGGVPDRWIIEVARHVDAIQTPASYTPTAGDFTVRIFQRRYQFDGVFDREDYGAWEAIKSILKTARAVPIPEGSSLGVFFDAPTDSSALISMSAIKAGSFESIRADPRDSKTAEEIEFYDAALNFEQVQWPTEHPTLADPSKFTNYRWRRIKLEGVTRQPQIIRHALRDLNVFALIHHSIKFQAGIDAFYMSVGEVFDFAHDTLAFGTSGVVWADSTNTTTVKLDREITIAAGKAYDIQIEFIGSDTRSTKSVDTAVTVPGVYAAGDTITMTSGFSGTPSKDDRWAIGQVTDDQVVKQFRIYSLAQDPKKMELTISATEYNPAVYLDEFAFVPDTNLLSNLPPPTQEDLPQGVNNLTADEATHVSPDGAVRVAATVSFTHPPATYHSVGKTYLYVSDGSEVGAVGGVRSQSTLVATLDAHTTSHTIDNYPFVDGQIYTIWARPETKSGVGQFRSYLSHVRFSPNGLAPTPLLPTGFSASVLGELATYQWDDDAKMRAFEIRRGGWILGQPVCAVPGGGTQHGPTADWVGAVAGATGFTAPPLYLRGKRGTGQYSPAAILAFEPLDPGNQGEIVFERNEEDASWPGALVGMVAYSPPSETTRVDPIELGDQLKTSAGGTHTYTTTVVALAKPQEVFLQVAVEIYQFHPQTIDELALLGPVGTPEVQRWTSEGPLVTVPGEVENATVTVKVAMSNTPIAGTDYQIYRPGVYRLQSWKVQVEVFLPSGYDFRLTRLNVRAMRKAVPVHNEMKRRVFS